MSPLHALAARGLLAASMTLVPTLALAQTVTATWDFSPASEAVVSYEACVSTSSLACDDVRWSMQSAQNWFSFTPTRGVLHLVTVRAVSSDGAGPYAPEIPISTPRLSPIADRLGAVGAATTFDPHVTDPDGSGVSFTAVHLPPGISIDGRSGRLSGTPTTTGTYRPTITVADAIGSDAQSFAWAITAGGTSGGGSAMTYIDLSFSGTQALGSAIVLSATGQGASTPMYRFWAQPWGGTWQIVQDWSASSTFSWRPTVAGGYNLTADGRGQASGNADVTTSRTIEIVASGGDTSPMSSVSLSFSPTTPQAIGTAVTLVARGQGGSGSGMYRFWVQPWGGQWQIVQDWSPTSTYTWRPSAAGGYNLTVYGRTGTTGGGVSDSRTFEATASSSGGTRGGTSPMTSVALSFTPTTPQATGTAVVLSAHAQGGTGTAIYRFWIQPWGGAWQIVQDWSASATVTWRPGFAGGYNLTVYGQNGTGGEGVSDSRTFEAIGSGTSGGGTRSPMTSVALSFTPTTPQAVGTAITLSARGEGGSGTPTYCFWIQPWGGAWQIVQDFSPSATVTWTPPYPGGYNLTVYGRTGTTGEGEASDSRTFEARH